MDETRSVSATWSFLETVKLDKKTGNLYGGLVEPPKKRSRGKICGRFYRSTSEKTGSTHGVVKSLNSDLSFHCGRYRGITQTGDWWGTVGSIRIVGEQKCQVAFGAAVCLISLVFFWSCDTSESLDKLKLMQCLHELWNFLKGLRSACDEDAWIYWNSVAAALWSCSDCGRNTGCTKLHQVICWQTSFLSVLFVSSTFVWPVGWNRAFFTSCLSASSCLSFHTAHSSFFSRMSKCLGVGGSAADGMAAAALVRTTRQSLKVW